LNRAVAQDGTEYAYVSQNAKIVAVVELREEGLAHLGVRLATVNPRPTGTFLRIAPRTVMIT
jgi:hypothetical protein